MEQFFLLLNRDATFRVVILVYDFMVIYCIIIASATLCQNYEYNAEQFRTHVHSLKRVLSSFLRAVNLVAMTIYL